MLLIMIRKFLLQKRNPTSDQYFKIPCYEFKLYYHKILEIQLILKPKENQYLQKSKEIQLQRKFTEIQNHPLRARLQTS